MSKKTSVLIILLISLSSLEASAQCDINLEWVNANAEDHWSPRSGHTSVVFDDKMWVMGGRDNTGLTNDVWSSTDGAYWNLVTASAEWSPREGHSSVAFDNGIWVIGGSSDKNDVWSSSDGADWVQATAAAEWSGRSGHTSVVFDGKMWVIGGSDENLDPFLREPKNDVWSSEDGETWTAATHEAPWVRRSAHTSVVLRNRMWIIGGARRLIGYDDSVGLSDIWSSHDGSNWTPGTERAPWINRIGHSSVGFHDRIWLISGVITRGIAGPLIHKDVWSSPDGRDWSRNTESADWSTYFKHASVSYKNKIWVLGGSDAVGPINEVWYSQPHYKRSDMNEDGCVDAEDLMIFQREWMEEDGSVGSQE